jgi:Trk-type K+ transport system membrane component
MIAGTINFAAQYVLLKVDFKRFLKIGEIKLMFLVVFFELISCSTAGGIKQYRIYVLYKSFMHNIKGFLLPPKRIKKIPVKKPEGKVYLEDNSINEVSNFVFIYIVLYLIGV